MPSMEYCVFENTYRDLKRCADAIEDGKELSKEEEVYKKRLIELCRSIVDISDDDDL